MLSSIALAKRAVNSIPHATLRTADRSFMVAFGVWCTTFSVRSKAFLLYSCAWFSLRSHLTVCDYSKRRCLPSVESNK